MVKRLPDNPIAQVLLRAVKESAHEARNRLADETDNKEKAAFDELEEEKARIEKSRLQKDHERGEILRDAINNTLIWTFRAVVIAIMVLGAVWAVHLIIPISWHWLTATQLSTIHNIFTGGIVSSVLIEYFRRRL